MLYPMPISAETAQPGLMESLTMPLMIVLMVVGMYFLMIRPQRKQQKKEKDMRDSLRIGDEIVTIGGISGRILRLSDDNVVIEVGADRTKLTFKKWAVQLNETKHDDDAEFDDDDDDDDI